MYRKVMFFSVTVARAIQLKHKASLISGLAAETAKLFERASNLIFEFFFDEITF